VGSSRCSRMERAPLGAMVVVARCLRHLYDGWRPPIGLLAGSPFAPVSALPVSLSPSLDVGHVLLGR
jgi:hypothetical protein